MSIHNMPDYSREIRRHQLKRFTARCWFVAAWFVLALAVGGMISQAHNLLFAIAVIVVLVGGYLGERYLSTHH